MITYFVSRNTYSIVHVFSFVVVMLEKEGFLEYLAKIIRNVASRSLDYLRSNTMLVAHCLGAMKTLAGLILSDTAPKRYTVLYMNDCYPPLISCIHTGCIKKVNNSQAA
jgi:hypothetical protein